jgi:hypothetical protein
LHFSWLLSIVLYPYDNQGDKNTATGAPVELSVDYNHLLANQGPGQCGCFSMNGGATEVAFHVYRGFSVVAYLTGEHSGSVNGGPQGLSLVPYAAGLRFTSPVRRHDGPFAQALFGVCTASTLPFLLRRALLWQRIALPCLLVAG